MAQHDYVISNGTGAAVRSDLNNALLAIVSQNSGATEPTTTYAYQWWADTTTGLLKIRNSANNAWITLRELDGTLTVEDGTVSAPGLAFRDDLNTGIWRPGTDQFAISTNGVERVEWGTSEVVFNDGGTNYDFRVEGDTNANLLFVDASADAVGIGTSSPGWLLSLRQDSASGGSGGYPVVQINNANAAGYAGLYLNDSTAQAGLETRRDTAHLSFYAGGNERARLDSSGRLGIGTTSPGANLEIKAASIPVVRLNQADTYYAPIKLAGNDLEIRGSSGTIEFYNGANDGDSSTEKMRIDGSGRLLVGTSSSSSNSRVVIQGSSASSANEAILRLANGSTTPSSGVGLGYLMFTDSNHSQAAAVYAVRDGGTWTSGSSHPSYLGFSTTADGASSPTERMRITSTGDVLVAKTTVGDLSAIGIQLSGGSFKGTGYFTAGDESGIFLNRQNSDGSLLNFYQANNFEGNISVSGTTVSYNGAHLSRWSQLPSGAERIEILRGSVLSNIDEMCEWGDEENEQLNRMKVSDVEGDKNVSGVFQCWDDDDDTYTNDFYCAMTGDFIIRIGAGVVVQRGDLLMSAGDGTAKPQGDDIVRSKTVAKVTSTTVSCTYDDGSYCVPCVLMAC